MERHSMSENVYRKELVHGTKSRDFTFLWADDAHWHDKTLSRGLFTLLCYTGRWIVYIVASLSETDSVSDHVL